MSQKLAIDGGTPAITAPLPPMFPGGMRIGDEEEAAVLEVLRSKRLFRYYGPSAGPSKAEAFEHAFAAHLGARYALAVTSGTASLMCALAGLGVGPGDEVIVPAYTWIATASAALAVGAVPVLAEVDESLTLSPADVERKITAHTRAIAAVHMRGAPCNMDALSEIARRRGIGLLEDVAQAAGASFRGRRLGTIGDAGAFSFQFNKIMTAGEGGAVLTDSQAVYTRGVMYHDVVGGLRNKVPTEEILPGVNFRMSELQAAVALAQLGKLDALLDDMRRNKWAIKERVADAARQAGASFRTLNDPAGDAAIALVLLLPDARRAQRAVEALGAEGLGAMVLFRPDAVDYHIYPHWAPIMHRRSWSEQGGPWRWAAREVEYTPDMCPQTLDICGRALHIDVSPDLTERQVEEVATALNKVLDALA